MRMKSLAMFNIIPQGHCKNCVHFHQVDGAPQCWRMPQPIQTKPGRTCGEWVKDVSVDQDELKRLVPAAAFEANPWLLEPLPYPFPNPAHQHKRTWPYAWHLVQFVRDFEEVGEWFAVKESTIHYIANRTRVSRHFRCRNDFDRVMQDRAAWMIDNIHLLLPTLVEGRLQARIAGTEYANPALEEGPVEEEPLYRRDDLFSARARTVLRAAGVKTWGDLAATKREWFERKRVQRNGERFYVPAKYPGAGPGTLREIEEVAARRGHKW